MGRLKDHMIEDKQEERETLEDSLDDIEAFGERFKWYVGGSSKCTLWRQLAE